jgi:hypothetical protein
VLGLERRAVAEAHQHTVTAGRHVRGGRAQRDAVAADPVGQALRQLLVASLAAIGAASLAQLRHLQQYRGERGDVSRPGHSPYRLY